MESEGTIAIIEDDVAIRDLVAEVLRANGFVVEGYGDAAAFFRQADVPSLDCLILDLMLPGEDGLSICRRLREAGNQIPVLMLTAKGDEVDRIVGLEMGADDYLPKPFNPRELLARIRAVLRRHTVELPGAPSAAEKMVSFGAYQLNLATRELSRDGEPVALTSGEFAVLKVLMEAGGGVISAEDLLAEAWDENADPFTNSPRVTVSHLRKKLGEPRIVHTVTGAGYYVAEAKR